MRMSTAGRTQGRRRLIYIVVGYAFFLALLGSQLATPLYRVYQAEFGFSALTLTLIFAVYPLAVIIALFIFGPLSDIVGRWLPLLASPPPSQGSPRTLARVVRRASYGMSRPWGDALLEGIRDRGSGEQDREATDGQVRSRQPKEG